MEAEAEEEVNNQIQPGKKRSISMEPKASLVPAKRQKPLPTAPRVEEHHDNIEREQPTSKKVSLLESVTIPFRKEKEQGKKEQAAEEKSTQKEKEPEKEEVTADAEDKIPQETKEQEEEPPADASTKQQQDEETKQDDGLPVDTRIEYLNDERKKSLQEIIAYDEKDCWEEPLDLTTKTPPASQTSSGTLDCEFDTAFWKQHDSGGSLIHKPFATGPVGKAYQSIVVVPSATTSPVDEKEGDRRSRRRFRAEARGDFEKKSSRVGHEYQAFIPPRRSDDDNDDENNNLKKAIPADLMWDPVRAKQAEAQGQDIEGFLRKGHESKVKFILMDSLHKSDYDTQQAMREFIKTCRADDNVSVEIKDEELPKFDQVFCKQARGKKDFKEASRLLGCTLETLLVQYYRWKGRCEEYARLKKQRLKEPDECKICDDGGLLLVCELCRNAFHLECLDPPLKEAPEGDWYCDSCMEKSPAKTRKLSVGTRSIDTSSACKLFDDSGSPQSKGVSQLSAKRTPSGQAQALNGKTPPSSMKSVSQSRRGMLMAVHKELKSKSKHQDTSRKHLFSPKGVKSRTDANGIVYPAGERKRDEDGLFARPRGPDRKGMRWSRVLGAWVPLYVTGSNKQNSQQSPASGISVPSTDLAAQETDDSASGKNEEGEQPSQETDDSSIDSDESSREQSPQDKKRKAPSSPSSNEDDDSSFHESDAQDPDDDDGVPEPVAANKMDSTSMPQHSGAPAVPPIHQPHYPSFMPGMYGRYNVPYGRAYMPATQWHPRTLPSLLPPGQQRPAHPGQSAKTSSADTAGQAVPTGTYFATVPITELGLLFHINKDFRGVGGAVRFSGYRRYLDGRKGPAEIGKVFRNVGDEILSIDGTSVTGMKWEDVVRLLRERKVGPNPVRVLHMRERQHERLGQRQPPRKDEQKAAGQEDQIARGSSATENLSKPTASASSPKNAVVFEDGSRERGFSVDKQSNATGLTGFADKDSTDKDLSGETAEAHVQEPNSSAATDQSQEEDHLAPKSAAPSESEQECTSRRNGTDYVAKIPVGLLFQVQGTDSAVSFAGYGTPGTELPEHVFRSVGDQIVAVDGVNCEGMTFQSTIELLKECRKRCAILSLSMRGKLPEGSDRLSSKVQAVERVPRGKTLTSLLQCRQTAGSKLNASNNREETDQSKEHTSAVDKSNEAEGRGSDSSDEVVNLGTKPAGNEMEQTMVRETPGVATVDSFVSPLQVLAKSRDAPSNSFASGGATRDASLTEGMAARAVETSVLARSGESSPANGSLPISEYTVGGGAILIEAMTPSGKKIRLERRRVSDLCEALGRDHGAFLNYLLGIGIVTCEAFLLSHSEIVARAFSGSFSEPNVKYVEGLKQDVVAYLDRKKTGS